jgi:transcriptional regulator with XRE-family HTH domain
MSHKLPNYLRAYRKRAGLTQEEVAYLLGCRSGAKVSRYERFDRQPNLETVFAYEVIFRTSPRELFAGIFHSIERTTSRRINMLMRKLTKAKADPMVTRKLEFLRGVGRVDPQDSENSS